MGQTKSKAVNEVLNEVRREYEEESISHCKGSGSVINELNLSDIRGDINLGDITQDNALELNVKCLSDMMTSLTYDNKMRTKLMAKAEAKDDRLFKMFENNESETQNITKNIISEYTKSVKKQIAESNVGGQNVINMRGVDGSVTVGNIVQKNKIQSIFDAAASSKNVVAAVAELDTASKGEALTESTFTSSFFSGLLGKTKALVPLVLAIAVLGVIVFLIVKTIKSPGGGGGPAFGTRGRFGDF